MRRGLRARKRTVGGVELQKHDVGENDLGWLLQDAVSRWQLLRNEKTDTLEKFIDQYEEHESGDGSGQSQVPRVSSGFSPFDFGLPQASRPADTI